MQDLSKVTSSQIFDITKNISMGLLTLMAVVAGSNLLPFYLTPVVGLLGATFLYTLLYNNKLRGGSSCLLISYSLFFCLIAYSFISILANVLYIWGLMKLPDEFIFFNDPYIPSLWLNPICFITLIVVYSRKRSLRLCIDCRLKNGSHADRGVYGAIINTESKVQLKNLIFLFGTLSVVVWAYYMWEYEAVNTTNARDRYIFFWITLIALFLDLVYFFYRYYNLYLDLKDNDELLSPAELEDMSNKIYLRFYVICGNKLYLKDNIRDHRNPEHVAIGTPFFTKRSVSGLTHPEVKDVIREMTGGKDGELRFFYGRKTPDIEKHSVMRYFYFLDGNVEDYEDMNAEGQWVDFEAVKRIYSMHPEFLTTMTANDISRLATIVVTNKMFTENGYRRNKLKSYQPSFDLYDVRNSKLDFQDDKWIRISLFNSDMPFYSLRRKFRNFFSGRRKEQTR